MATAEDDSRIETSHFEKLPSDGWMVRPCELYKEEYSDCKSIRARFHQYFVFGESLDCSQWKRDFENCMKWRKYEDINALNQVLESEKQRINTRLQTAMANDVWQPRTEPPADWNAPLPDWMLKANENAYFAVLGNENTEVAMKHQRSCVIL